MFRKIVVPLDGSALAEGIFPHVLRAAATFGASVTLVHVTEAPSRGRIDLLDWQLHQAEVEAYLHEQCMVLRNAGLNADSCLLEGPAAERIVEFAHRQDSDLIILSSHGSGGMSEWNVSQIAQKVMQRSTTSVLLVPAEQPNGAPSQPARYRRIMVPLDGSQRAENVLPVARALAANERATLLLTHVTGEPFIFQRLPATGEENAAADWLVRHNRAQAADYLQSLAPLFSPNVEIALPVSDNVALALHQMVTTHAADLVLLSAHGHSGRREWAYGSIVANFIANGSTPLLIVQDLPQPLSHQTLPATARRQGLYGIHVRSAPLPTRGRKRATVSSPRS